MQLENTEWLKKLDYILDRIADENLLNGRH